MATAFYYLIVFVAVMLFLTVGAFITDYFIW